MDNPMQTLPLTNGSKLKGFVKSCFPYYRKSKVYLHVHETNQQTLVTHPGGWDHGSIDNDWIVKAIDSNLFEVNDAPQATYANFDRETGFPKVIIDDITALVTDGVSDGVISTILIHCTKAFFEKYLG